MKFVASKEQLGMNPEQFMRRAGYSYVRDRQTGQDSFVRRLGKNYYPRFHMYPSHMGENVVFNLHLDQKKPSYAGAKAHNAEYEGELLEKEMERLKEIIIKNSCIAWQKKLEKIGEKEEPKGLLRKLLRRK
jgi:hypothetical protein